MSFCKELAIANCLARSRSLHHIFTDSFGVGDRVGPEVGLCFVKRAAFGAFETGNGRRDRVRAFVIDNGAIFAEVVEEISMPVDSWVYDDCLWTGRSVNGLAG